MDGHEMKKLSKRGNISHLLLWCLKKRSCGSSCHQPSLIKALNIQIQQTPQMPLSKVLHLTAVKTLWQSDWALINWPLYICLHSYCKWHTEERTKEDKWKLVFILHPLSYWKIHCHLLSLFELHWNHSEILAHFPTGVPSHQGFSILPQIRDL